jgi:hypothetical protein
LDRAVRHNFYRSWTGNAWQSLGAFWSDIELGSVQQHHPDAIPSITRLQFAQLKKIVLKKLIVRDHLEYFYLQAKNQPILI